MTEQPTDQLPEHLDDVAAADERLDVPRTGPLRFARMTGSSIAGRDAAPWITDFLNAAYYRRPVDERDVDDLRLAFAILTTYWYRNAAGRRLRVTDLPAFHRAFGGERFDTGESGRGVLSRGQLLAGASRLLGDWFPEAYADDARRGWGIAFSTVEERAAYDPERRMALARLHELARGGRARGAAVAHLSAGGDAVRRGGHRRADAPPDVAGLRQRDRALHPAARGRDRWPDVRDRGRRGHGVRASHLHARLRHHHGPVTPDDPEALAAWFEALEEGMARHGEARIVPEGGTPLVGFDLTTRRGHFMGNGHNRLVLYTHEGKAWVRAAGTWDAMPWHIERAYKLAGSQAQHAFWGQGGVERLSLLHQLARRIAG